MNKPAYFKQFGAEDYNIFVVKDKSYVMSRFTDDPEGVYYMLSSMSRVRPASAITCWTIFPRLFWTVFPTVDIPIGSLLRGLSVRIGLSTISMFVGFCIIPTWTPERFCNSTLPSLIGWRGLFFRRLFIVFWVCRFFARCILGLFTQKIKEKPRSKK